MHSDTDITKIVIGAKAKSQSDVDVHIADQLFVETNVPKKILLTKIENARINNKRVIGDGISIPNLEMVSLKKPISILLTLQKPIDLGAPDNALIDLVCVLASPKDDGPIHLRRLSRLSRLFKDKDLTDQMRSAQSEEEIRAILDNPSGWLIAA